MHKIIGYLCLAGGVALVARGYTIAQSLNSQVKHIFTGSPTSQAVHCYIGGALLGMAGLALIFWKRK